MKIRQAITFDDVLLQPGASEVMPADVNVSTFLTKAIPLNIPLISAAMDTVTEARLAIAMAQSGGIGVIHRNLSIEQQAGEVAMVKKYESGVVMNPVTISPSASLGDLVELKQRTGFSGVPVVDKSGKVVGIITNRDTRFADDVSESVANLMTKEVVTVKMDTPNDEARRLLHKHRIERLVIVDDDNRCVGLLTVKDMDKAAVNPNAAKDAAGRLRVAAASTVGDAGFERTEALIAAGVDCVIIDTAHGHSISVAQAVERAKKISNSVQIIAGNVATAEATKALIDAGADAVKVGIGPGSICTTRIVAGVGVPQLTAIEACANAAQASGVPVIADGGIKFSGDFACIRAAPTRPIAAWAASAQWRAARPTVISKRTRRRRSWCRKALRARCRSRVRSVRSSTRWWAACARRWAMSAPRISTSCTRRPNSSRSPAQACRKAMCTT